MTFLGHGLLDFFLYITDYTLHYGYYTTFQMRKTQYVFIDLLYLKNIFFVWVKKIKILGSGTLFFHIYFYHNFFELNRILMLSVHVEYHLCRFL